MLPAMGRRRTRNFDLPPLVVERNGRYYYGRNQVYLADNKPDMLMAYARVHDGAISGPASFAEAVRHYIRDELPSKASSTQTGYLRQLPILTKAFGKGELGAIRPLHVQQFLTARGNSISAAREKALFSAVFNFARRTGLTDAPNPCQGIRGRKASRDRYVTDAELSAVLERADATLRAFLLLCYYTGQDAGRVCKLTRADVRDGALWVQRSKTGNKVRIALSGPLATLLARLTVHSVGSLYLIRDARGQPLTLQCLRRRFEGIRRALGTDWQIRDLRAKAATDLGDNVKANKLLAHSAMTTTDGYVRKTAGTNAEPVMRDFGTIADDLPELRIDHPAKK